MKATVTPKIMKIKKIKSYKLLKEINSLQETSDDSPSTPVYKKRTKTEIKAVRKKRRSGDAFATPVKRIAWTQEEKSVVLATFREQLQADTPITGKEMKNLITSTPCLAKRTVPQIRTWLYSQKQKGINF
ncbi:uncharacterized protein LOC116852200 [Odontomachus brunneus]|uniref:uncharacterized protein LOC116852200 n=1 Tax=Odontomachus brunneus TaxID=486640 RepID=UPI0013F25F08|nr:uncharacterized protein LOC116852200 [Odontomachus brunneus]